MSAKRRDTVDDIKQLPSEIRSEVDRMVADYSYTLLQIREWLHERGYEIRGSTLGRYHQEQREAALELIK